VVFSINTTDHHDITEILLKVALNTIALDRYLLLIGVDRHAIILAEQIKHRNVSMIPIKQ